MFGYFWSRNATLGMAALYLVLGIVLLLFPGMSGTVFCWGMAAGAGLYAAGNFWRWHQGKSRAIPCLACFWPGFWLLFCALCASSARSSSFPSCRWCWALPC